MITNYSPPREGGRPRSFENGDVFRATASVLTRLGYGGLTLEAVAQEIGCSAPAISKRFGSKQALVHSYLEWTLIAARERFRTARQSHASPLTALWARYLAPFEERPEELSAFAGWIDMRNDAMFGSLLQKRRRLWEREAASMLAAAQKAGELNACDTDELARAVTAALAGATVLWSPDDGPLLARYAT
ncbi:MAG: TetR/AcrR family transcriptional regulator, partial [Thermomicrobiales bacterium]